MYEEDYGDDQAAAEEAAYQEMCDAGADFEQQQMIMEGEAEAEKIRQQVEEMLTKQREEVQKEELRQLNLVLEHGTINKDPDSKVSPDELRHTNMFKQGMYAKHKIGHTHYCCEKCGAPMDGPGSYDGEYSNDPAHYGIGLCNKCIEKRGT